MHLFTCHVHRMTTHGINDLNFTQQPFPNHNVITLILNSTTISMFNPSTITTIVQRIPRYKMLLSELLSKTSQYHKDFASLTEALKAVSDIADYVNEKIRAFESEERLVSLFSQFEEDMIKDGMEEKEMSEKQTRRYQMEILKNVKFFSSSKHLKMQKVNFYLFNDLILVSLPPPPQPLQ